ncbi:MAG TPA: sialate O-acetylesterase, partial [Bacteroidota bacterium]|nr:sialate O-acetylesterase [Bacteroidota bacterium]
MPGSRIVVVASWKKGAETTVNSDGSWLLSLATPKAGGPYEIEFRHDQSSTALKNVLIGEVWLCSGQSNMEMPLQGWPPDSIMWAKEEIANSSNDAIRLFTVRRAYSPSPEWSCAGRWESCAPQTSAGFSATAYFFGRKLQQTLHVPIGLIHSSWGGTPIEAWTSAEFISRVARYDSVIQKMRVSADSMKLLKAWLERFPVMDMSARDAATKWQHLTFQDDQCALSSYADSAWHIMHLPTYWEQTGLGEFDGVVWFRKQVTIPPSWVHKDLILELGPVDDMDVSFVNGHQVGSHETEGLWRAERVYSVPANIVDSTAMTIAVRVLDIGGGGGIYGPAASMS